MAADLEASYRYAFENSSTYRDGSVNPTDLSIICRRFKLDYNAVMNSIATDGEGRYSLNSFIHYLKPRHHQHSNGSGPGPPLQGGPHPSSSHHGYYDQEPSYSPPTTRPSSGSKLTRQGVYSSSGHHHHSTAQPSSSSSGHRYRYPLSPTMPTSGGVAPSGGGGGGAGLMGVAVPFNDNEDFTPEELQTTVSKRRQEMTRTPEHYISADEKTTSRLDHERLRLHTPHASHTNSTRLRPGAISRGTIDSPPPPTHSTHHSSRRQYRDRDVPTRPERTFRDDDSADDEPIQDTFYPPPPTHPSRSHTTKKCKQCDRQKETYTRQLAEVQEDLKITRVERERLEQNNERLRKDLQMAPNTDVAYGQLYHENEKLRQDIKRLRKESNDMDQDRGYYDRQQFEDLKKAKEDVVEECVREKSAHKAYKKECAALKSEYNIIRLKNEELLRSNWQLKDENQKLLVRVMKEGSTSPISRRAGGGDSGEGPVRSTFASEIGFHRQTNIRQTYHFTGGGGRNEVTRDSSRSHRNQMKRTSSEGKALDYDEPVKETSTTKHENYRSSKAKTHKSAGTSDVGSVGDSLMLLASSVPDEQSQVFMVLDESVSKSVLPEGLPKEQELAIIYSLQNCHSIQEIIKCLVSYRASNPTDKLSGFQVENEHLKCCVDHLMARLSTMTNSFEKAKEEMVAMYHKANKFEANNVRLRHALKLCQQAREVNEILLEYKSLDMRHHGSGNSSYFPSYDSSFDTTARSPDRVEVLTATGVRNCLPGRARALLNQLEANPELQSYLPYYKLGKGHSGEYQGGHGQWHPGTTLSQNTGTTSGLSSMSGGTTDIDITPSDLDRLKQYSQALLRYENHLISTLVVIDGLNGLSTVKKQEKYSDSVLSDPQSSGGGRREANDMEDAAHAEELCKIREEKAELKSQIYMMEQEKRRMELEVGRLTLQKQKSDEIVTGLQFRVGEEKRKRKKERKRKSEAAIPSHDPTHMSELSIEYSSALEREKELSRRYEELFTFLRAHVKDSQDTTDDLMRFVKELRRANSGLVDAFEKSKKRQQAEKRRMKQELVSYMNRCGQVEEPSNGASVYP